jgi:hypothetical protein
MAAVGVAATGCKEAYDAHKLFSDTKKSAVLTG